MAAQALSESSDRPSQAPARHVRWRQSLSLRIALWSGLVAVTVVVLMTAAMAAYAHWKIDREARLDTLTNARQAAEQLATTMNTVTVTTGALSDLAANSTLDPEALTTTLRAMVRPPPAASAACWCCSRTLPDSRRSPAT